jgi:hypothetical protein
LLDPGDDDFVSAIRPNQFETTRATVKTMFDLLEQFFQNQLASVPILQARPMDHYQQKQDQTTYNNGEDIPIEDITHKQLKVFFSALTTVSNKTLLNHYIRLSSLWTGVMRELKVHHPVVHNVTSPNHAMAE